MIDAGLTELGMIIAPDQFDGSRSKRKKGSSSYGYGYYSSYVGGKKERKIY